MENINDTMDIFVDLCAKHNIKKLAITFAGETPLKNVELDFCGSTEAQILANRKNGAKSSGRPRSANPSQRALYLRKYRQRSQIANPIWDIF